MKLNLKKAIFITLLCSAATGITTQCMAHDTETPTTLSQPEHEQLHQIGTAIQKITHLSLYLASKIDNNNDRDSLDIIVRKIESLEPSLSELTNNIKNLIDNTTTEGAFKEALTIKYEVVVKVNTLLNQFATILKTNMLQAAADGDPSAWAVKFMRKVKAPLTQLAAPSEFDYFDKKLSGLHSIMEDLNSENANIIKELIALLQKIKHLTESNGKSKLEIYRAISKKFPTNRKPFANIPATISLDDWIQEMPNNMQ